MSIKQGLVAVAIAGVFLGVFRMAVWVLHPSAGPLASQLKARDEVVTSCETTAILLEKSDPGSELRLAAGTRCIVVSDPAGDEDDCYFNEDRLITIKFTEGRGPEVTLTLARRDLRLIPRWHDFRNNR